MKTIIAGLLAASTLALAGASVAQPMYGHHHHMFMRHHMMMHRRHMMMHRQMMHDRMGR